MLILLGVLVLVVVIGAGIVVSRLSGASASPEDVPPPSSADFVAPVSSRDFRFRRADESADAFRERVGREADEVAASSKRGG